MNVRASEWSSSRHGTRLAAVTSMLMLALLVGGGEQSNITADGGSASTLPPTVSAVQEEAQVQTAAPVRIRIPEIDVDAAVEPLEINEKGALLAPDSSSRTGWWRDGPEPGEYGPAVIVGHVDSHHGPAVFFRLDDLAKADRVFIDRANGTSAVFAVQRVEQHAKEHFPTEDVYGDTSGAQLRLITCGGTFDDRRGSYRSNVIAFAELIR